MRDDERAERRQRTLLYYGAARQYLEGYRIIAQQRPDEIELEDAKHFLLCRSLELALKGWLVLREGTSQAELRNMRPNYKGMREFGHNLKNLAEATAKYHATVQALLPSINWLNQSYQSKDYEYPEWADDDGVSVTSVNPERPFPRFVSACVDALGQQARLEDGAAPNVAGADTTGKD